MGGYPVGLEQGKDTRVYFLNERSWKTFSAPVKSSSYFFFFLTFNELERGADFHPSPID